MSFPLGAMYRRNSPVCWADDRATLFRIIYKYNDSALIWTGRLPDLNMSNLSDKSSVARSFLSAIELRLIPSHLFTTPNGRSLSYAALLRNNLIKGYVAAVTLGLFLLLVVNKLCAIY